MTTTPTDNTTPRELGYYFPAEWTKHDATWLAWPHAADDWPGKLAAVQWAYAEIIRVLVRTETVHLLVASKRQQAAVTALLGRIGTPVDRVQFFLCPTDRSWIRDYGPLFLRHESEPGRLAIARFRFNGWARYPDWNRDDAVPAYISERLNMPMFAAESQRRPIILEGGSVEVNGAGTLVTTEQCVLNTNTQDRNPDLSRHDMMSALQNFLGVSQVLWLGEGLSGDETHGHIDNLCRFIRPDVALVSREANPRDENYRPLEENWERLQNVRLADDRKLETIALPLPGPHYLDGDRLPISYANFYIANELVLVPTFNDVKDRLALGILTDIFPDHSIVGIHATDLAAGGGTLHCITQQQPVCHESKVDASTSGPAFSRPG